MVGGAGRLVAQRQECRDWPIPAEPAAEELGCEQELDEEAQALQANAPGVVQALQLLMTGHRLQNRFKVS